MRVNPSSQEKIDLYKEVEAYSKHFPYYIASLYGERKIEFEIMAQKFFEIYDPERQIDEYYHYLVLMQGVIEKISNEDEKEKIALFEQSNLYQRVKGIIEYVNKKVQNDLDELDNKLFLQLIKDLEYLMNSFSFLILEYPKTSTRKYSHKELELIGNCVLYFQENAEYEVFDHVFQENILHMAEKFESINRVQCKIMLQLIKKHKKGLKFQHNCKEIVKGRILVDYYKIEYCDKDAFDQGFEFLWEFHDLLLMDDKYINNFTKNMHKIRKKAEKIYGKIDFQNYSYPNFKDDDSQKTKRLHIDQYISFVVKGHYIDYENLVFLNSLIQDYEEREKIKQIIKIRKEIVTKYDGYQYIEKLISDKSVLEKYEFFRNKR